MMNEELEFRIAQYADGTLPARERAALEAELQENADARAMLAEYRALDAALKGNEDVPRVQWDRLASRIDAVVSEQAKVSVVEADEFSRVRPHAHASVGHGTL